MPVAPPPGYLSHFARLQHALELRREGRTYREIADRVGLKDEKAAQALISKAIKRVLRETAEEVRSIELSRLELLIKLLWEQMVTDLQGKDPDYRRFDRVKQLIEQKLKWCGAQPVVDDNTDKRVTIVIQKFTNNTQINNGPALLPAPPIQNSMEEELSLLLPENGVDKEEPL